MHVQSVIEITPTDGHLPAAVIVSGYRSSQYGLVIFILNEVTAAAINLVLDPIVNTMPLSIPGVLYVQISDETRVRQAVTSAETIYVATEFFQNLAIGYGAVSGILHPIAQRRSSQSCLRKQVPPVKRVEPRELPRAGRRTTKVVLYQAHRAQSSEAQTGSVWSVAPDG